MQLDFKQMTQAVGDTGEKQELDQVVLTGNQINF